MGRASLARPSLRPVPTQSPLEAPIVNTQGILQIDWPRLLGSSDPVPLDLLLATANEPSLEGDAHCYPSVETIAVAWKRSSEEAPQDKRESYFWENKKARITTFEDKAMSKSQTIVAAVFHCFFRYGLLENESLSSVSVVQDSCHAMVT